MQIVDNATGDSGPNHNPAARGNSVVARIQRDRIGALQGGRRSAKRIAIFLTRSVFISEDRPISPPRNRAVDGAQYSRWGVVAVEAGASAQRIDLDGIGRQLQIFPGVVERAGEFRAQAGKKHREVVRSLRKRYGKIAFEGCGIWRRRRRRLCELFDDGIERKETGETWCRDVAELDR